MFLLIPVSTSTTSTTISEDVPLTLKWFLFLQDDKGEVCFQELTDGCRVLCVYLFSQCFFNVRCADCPSSTCRLLLTWSGVGRTFVQMSLVTDHPAGRITALLCSPCFAGPPPPCTLCRAWLRRLSALFFRLPPQCNVWRSNVRYSASREYPGQFLFKTSVWWGWGMRMPRRHCLNRKSQSKDIFSLYAVHWLYKVYIVFSFTWSSYREIVLPTFFHSAQHLRHLHLQNSHFSPPAPSNHIMLGTYKQETLYVIFLF